MNKSTLINVLAEKSDLSKRNAEQFVNLMIDAMISAMAQEDRIEIRGFGSFVIRHYGSYEGRNPKTGQTIKITDKRLPFFKAGKDLLSRIN
ncbi:MAG TPA: HU family DNA-binding protein [bacterium]|jgi:integration host factor subunit beta|nr:integration host factor subunit beta [bacterium]MDX9804713.1 HU family DNA-binding protein [bacterium]HNW15279.1 HU family DNA-binding protein [bacterium]HNZ53806.1 HU family DNA-binding protein [bacterium]HOB70556.1 HU family DNA-binding protein [bacterium]